MRGLVFAQSINMEARHDATGAFIPGARRFVSKHSLDRPVWLDDHNDRETMIGTIARARDLDVIAYFGHGTRSSLPSANIRWMDIRALADAVLLAASPHCRVVLYACSSGEIGRFANQLAKLMDYKVTVWGHTCVGHSFTNPYVTRFPHDGDDTAFLIDPRTPMWRSWVRHIKGPSDIWTRFPFLSKEAVETEITSGVTQEIVDPRSLLIDI